MLWRQVSTLEHSMKAIATGMLGFLLVSATATAQTAAERDRILQDFQQSVAEYDARPHCLALFPEAVTATAPVPRIFTPPVAMVFRQLIAAALTARDDTPAMRGVSTPRHHAGVLEPFPSQALNTFPEVVERALPPLPARLEYRLIDNDLVLRDAEAGVIVAVLRDALATVTTLKD
jgi:hypothetical protein